MRGGLVPVLSRGFWGGRAHHICESISITPKSVASRDIHAQVTANITFGHLCLQCMILWPYLEYGTTVLVAIEPPYSMLTGTGRTRCQESQQHGAPKDHTGIRILPHMISSIPLLLGLRTRM